MFGILHVPNLDQNKPAVIPTARTFRIPDDKPFGLIQALRAEWIVIRQTSQLAEKVIGINIMSPCACHGLCDLRDIEVSEHPLDSTKFGNCVDSMGAKRVNELFLIVLQVHLISL
jgi:hypothetical protein